MSWTNSTADHPLTVCDPCMPTTPTMYSLGLAILNALAVPVLGVTVWSLVSSPFTEKTDLLSFNMIFSDFLLCLSSALTMVGILLRLQFPHFVWGFLLFFITCSRPLFQCLICMERYLAVEHPTVFLRYRPLRFRLYLLAAVWLVLLLTGCGAAIACGTHQNPNKPYLSFQCAVLIIIFTVNSFCSVCILRALLRPPPGDGRLKDLKDRQKEKKNGGDQIKNKAFRVVSMVQVYLTVCYLPPLLIISLARFIDKTSFCAVYLFHLWFVLLTSCLYCLFHLHSKGELKQCACSRC